MKGKILKPLGPKNQRAHIDNDVYCRRTDIWSRKRENEIRQKEKKKASNRRKNKLR